MLEIRVDTLMFVYRSQVRPATFEANSEGRGPLTGRCRVPMLKTSITLGKRGAADELFGAHVFSIHVNPAALDKVESSPDRVVEVPYH